MTSCSSSSLAKKPGAAPTNCAAGYFARALAMAFSATPGAAPSMKIRYGFRHIRGNISVPLTLSGTGNLRIFPAIRTPLPSGQTASARFRIFTYPGSPQAMFRQWALMNAANPDLRRISSSRRSSASDMVTLSQGTPKIYGRRDGSPANCFAAFSQENCAALWSPAFRSSSLRLSERVRRSFSTDAISSGFSGSKRRAAPSPSSPRDEVREQAHGIP